MTILVTGGTGQVGFELQRALAPLGQIDAPPRNQLELLDPAAVNSYLKARNPGLIVNAAAYTAVDRAESEPETAHALNAGLPQILAEYAADKGVWLIHYSSDYVYPGGGDAPWSETDTPARFRFMARPSSMGTWPSRTAARTT